MCRSGDQAAGHWWHTATRRPAAHGLQPCAQRKRLATGSQRQSAAQRLPDDVLSAVFEHLPSFWQVRRLLQLEADCCDPWSMRLFDAFAGFRMSLRLSFLSIPWTRHRLSWHAVCMLSTSCAMICRCRCAEVGCREWAAIVHRKPLLVEVDAATGTIKLVRGGIHIPFCITVCSVDNPALLYRGYEMFEHATLAVPTTVGGLECAAALFSLRLQQNLLSMCPHDLAHHEMLRIPLQVSGANPEGAGANAGWHAMIMSSPAQRLQLRLTGTTTRLLPVVRVQP